MGFGVAAAAAYLLDYLDDTVKTPQDVEGVSGLPTLAGIARMKSENGSYELITSKHPRSPISEAYRVLRTGIQFSDVDKLHKTLLISSPSPVEGKSHHGGQSGGGNGPGRPQCAADRRRSAPAGAAQDLLAQQESGPD
jgi:hypothetical protein